MEHQLSFPESEVAKTSSRSEFSNWLHDNSSFYRIQVFGLLAIAGAVLEPIAHIKDIFNETNAQHVEYILKLSIYALQLIFILFVILVLNRKSFIESIEPNRYKIYHKMIVGKDLTKNEVQATTKMNELNTRLFARYWLLFWKWLFILYLVLFTRVLLDKGYAQNQAYFVLSNVIETFLNNISMCNLLICFFIVSSPLASLKYNSQYLTSEFNKLLSTKNIIYVVVVGFSIVHLFSLVWILKSNPPAKPILPENLVIYYLTINSPFKIISGIFNCFALALLIARLDSKIANVPSFLISVLVLYAALQPLYVFFDNPTSDLIVIVVSSLTLYFKIYFYIIVAYIINTGRLGDLFMTFPLVKKMVEIDGYKQTDKEEEFVNKMPAETIVEFTKHVEMINMMLDISGFKTITRIKKIMSNVHLQSHRNEVIN